MSTFIRIGWRAAGVIVAAATLAGCSAQRAYWNAESLRATGQDQEALARYEAAWRAEPGNAEYRQAFLLARERLVQQRLKSAESLVLAGSQQAAEQAFRQVLSMSPSEPRALAGLKSLERARRLENWMAEASAALLRQDWDFAQQRLRALLQEQPDHAEARRLLSIAEDELAQRSSEQSLSAYYRKQVTLEFREAPLRSVFEALSRSTGLNFVFDRELRLDGRATLFARDTTLEAALQMLFAGQQMEGKVLNANSLFVYPNTSAKLKEHQAFRVRSYYLAHADAKTVAATLKTLARAREVVVDEKLNLLIVRDVADTLRLVDKLVALHDIPDAEVMLEVEVLEVKRSRLLDLGVRWPDQLTLAPLASAANGTLTLADLRNLDSGRISAALGSVSVGVNQTDTDANILANPRIRTRNREKARVLIGERVPNITTSATSTGFLSESINYIDVGLKLDVEPTVYADGEVVIRLGLEVSNIIGQLQTKAGSLAYQIGTRSAQTVLRLRDGENQILAGLINDEERTSANKVPGVGAIPVFGRLFGRHSDTATKTEIVLSITPRLVRAASRPPAAQLDFEAGTETSAGVRSLPGLTSAAPRPASAVEPHQELAGAHQGLPPDRRSSAGPNAPVNEVPGPGEMPRPNGATMSHEALPLLHWQGPASVRPGEVFTATLLVQAPWPLTRAVGQLVFDPKQVEVLQIEEGSAFQSDGANTRFSSTPKGPGSVRWSVQVEGRTGVPQRSVAGSLLQVRLRALEPGELKVALAGEGWTGPNAQPAAPRAWTPLLVKVLP